MKRATFTLSAIGVAILLSFGLREALQVAPTEATMGNIQRIFYYHVPSYATAFAMFAVNLLASIFYLVRRHTPSAMAADAVAVSAAEIGVIFCSVGLMTGMLWAKPVWGNWWTCPSCTCRFAGGAHNIRNRSSLGSKALQGSIPALLLPCSSTSWHSFVTARWFSGCATNSSARVKIYTRLRRCTPFSSLARRPVNGYRSQSSASTRSIHPYLVRASRIRALSSARFHNGTARSGRA